MSAFSCVSVLPSEELDKLLDDVRSLGDSNLQVPELCTKLRSRRGSHFCHVKRESDSSPSA